MTRVFTLFLRLAVLLFAAFAQPAAAQDRSGLIEMEAFCYKDPAHPRYQSKLCKAFRYGIDYRNLQIARESLQINSHLLGRSMDTGQTLPSQVMRPGAVPGQLFDKTNSNRAIQQIIIPPTNLNPNLLNQVVR